ncbi:SIS domain-containing protein [Vibrio sp. T187]|uniref:SIS domain-containing protein n=1 Tax=Vibrio TaxID=662 RepID=UPI0010C9EB2F|nr:MULTISPECIES: SIS domain-containing protein [Vibrio]MBW3698207.1 SIS domain-containing protein [Vibrio sp. T187]
MRSYLGYEEAWLESKNAIHTAKEISQQPRFWQQTAQLIKQHSDELNRFLEPILAQHNIRVILTGAGTSAFAGKAISPWLNTHCDAQVDAIASTELVSNPYQYFDPDVPTLVVSFARSGNSPESVAAVELANQVVNQCYHLFLTCNPDGQLAKQAEVQSNAYCLLMPEGSNDLSFAMTSSFSCMTLSALATVGQIPLDELDGVVSTISEISEQALVNWQGTSKKLAATDYQRLVFLGSGGLSGLAQEAALKSLELSAGQIMTAFDSSLGFRHGPKFIVDPQTVVVQMLSSNVYTRRYDNDLLNELKSDGIAQEIVVLSGTQSDLEACSNQLNLNCDLEDVWLTFPYILFAQMLAFEKSLALGLTPDNPCPSGEVNRVVQGVKIHNF